MKVKFYRTATLVNHLIEAKTEGKLNKFLKQIQKTELLICDEWGYIPLDREGVQLLFQVIAKCYEKRSLIITTNLEFSKWINIFYDERMTNVIINRFIHHSYLLIFIGENCRLNTLPLSINVGNEDAGKKYGQMQNFYLAKHTLFLFKKS
ncbi:hypothetical protein BBF96_00890 [Anoxybacter fermentans]|uniref:IstB-like ATP-binding domain-containing protein n=1 Tax=Anoxybacter fermentans TaxID=1323375 RepID=A0A3Q9HNH8_9FIRM|nr:hypothetical protein BBF96_00890 [Anoxybacter fermentans]